MTRLWIFPEAQQWITAVWELKPPTECTEFTKSNMYNETCQEVRYIKTQVSPSMGISADANLSCHDVTFNPWRINNLSNQPSIRSTQTPRPQDISATEKHRELINIPLHQQTDWSQWDVQLPTRLFDETQWGEVQATTPRSHLSLVWITFLLLIS